MAKTHPHEVIISACRTRLWVNSGEDGSCLGRVDLRSGIDLHLTVAEQFNTGRQCLDCTHLPPTKDEWNRFRAGLLEHYGVDVPEDALDFEKQIVSVAQLLGR